CWLFAPSLVTFLMPRAGPQWLLIYEWIRPIVVWIGSSSPFWLVGTIGTIANAARLMEALGWMIGLQVVYGVLFVGIAVLRLRPVGQKEGGGAGRGWIQALSRKQRIFPRPPCGDDAMMWKERHVS